MKDSNKMKKIITIMLIVILVIVGIVSIYCYSLLKSPEKIYKKAVFNIIDAIMIPAVDNTGKTFVTNTSIDLELETEGLDTSNSILNLINNGIVQLNTQHNNSEGKFVIGAAVSHEQENLINAKMFVDTKNKTTHIYSKELLDKYVELGLDKNLYTFLEEWSKLSQSEAQIMLANCLKQEFASIIKSEYCSKENVAINIGDKQMKVTDYKLTMTLHQYVEEFASVLLSLENNEQFLVLMGERKEDVVEILDAVIDTLQDYIESGELKDTIVSVNIYMKGFIPELVKTEVSLVNRETQKRIEIINVSKDVINANIEISLNKTDILKIKAITQTGYSDSIENTNPIKTTNLNGLTEIDLITFIQNIQENRLYKIITENIQSSLVMDSIYTTIE